MKKNFTFFSAFFFGVLATIVPFNLICFPVAQAAVFVVDATVADGDPASLRNAVEQANATAGQDTIRLRPGRYMLDLGQLEIQQSLAIIGSGARKSLLTAAETAGFFILQRLSMRTSRSKSKGSPLPEAYQMKHQRIPQMFAAAEFIMKRI